MALNNHVENFTLDMAPGGIAPVLNVSQGDTGRAYTADMYWGGASYDVSGLTVRLRGRKRDNTVFDYALPAPSGTKVSFDLQDKEQVTIIPGNVECELVFTDSNSRVVGTANFVIIVEESPYDPNAISESEVTGLVDLISDQIGGAVDEWMETEAPTSPEFAAAVQDATDAYLDENGITIEYDDIVGKPDFEAVENAVKVKTATAWELGNIDLAGVPVSSSVRARTVNYVEMTASISVLGYGLYSYRFYDDNGTFTESTNWLSAETVPEQVKTNNNSTKCKLVYKNANDTTIGASGLGLVESGVTIKTVQNLSDILENDLTKNLGLTWALGHIDPSGIDTSVTNRIREAEFLPFDVDTDITIDSDVKYTLRVYDRSGVLVRSTGWLYTSGQIQAIYQSLYSVNGSEKTFRIAAAYSNDATVEDVSALSAKIDLKQKYEFSEIVDIVTETEQNDDITINATGTGNCSIRCAKEQSYTDGSAPQIEYFLLEEPLTHKFYLSRDLKDKKYLFTFSGEPHKYSFGILQNGDIIACLDADAIPTNTKDDANRENPFVFLASENWEVQHEVNFGTSKKPCGWLENCGFKVLADGSAIFCEYTRQTTATANAWKLSGDPLNPSNWVNTKAFTITTTDNNTNFKHCHMVTQDFYTGVCYLATGDDNKGAMLFYSSDNGVTWTQLQSPDSAEHEHEDGYYGGSEKYCRMLSMTFTKDFIYWATDAAVTANHFLFKVERDADGVLDYSTVAEVVNIPKVNNAATYGTAYIPELDAIFLLDRTDGAEVEMPLRLVTLSDGVLHTFGKLEVVDRLAGTGGNLGFRTRFSEWYPYNGLVRVGYGLKMLTHNMDCNQNKGFGNAGNTSTGAGSANINNLFLQVFKNGDNFGVHIGTYYI